MSASNDPRTEQWILKPAKKPEPGEVIDVVIPDVPEVSTVTVRQRQAEPAEKPAAEVKPVAEAKPAAPVKPQAQPAAPTKPQVKPAAQEKAAAWTKPGEKPAAEATPAEPVKPEVKPEAQPEMTIQVRPEGRPEPVADQISNLVKFGVDPVLPYSIEEAINRLRINISFLGGDVKKIMVVSSEPNEGKSFVTMNLWKQMAIAGEPSVLVDLDMRNSTMAIKYHLSRADGKELKGTSHFLSGNDKIEDMILHTEMEKGDLLPNVDNIVNPSMLFESRKFREMMDYMNEHYRYVFLDVPPLGLVSDGELIGSFCDGAVLCVRGGVTSRSIIRRSIQQLERAGCPILGIVLNRVGGSGTGYYHKYYGKKKYYNDQYYSK